MNKVYLIFMTIILASCYNQKKETVIENVINPIEEKTPIVNIEKISPQILVSKGKKSNEFGFKECVIKLSLNNHVEKFDSFFPSYINRKELIYCDLAKNPTLLGMLNINYEDIINEPYPKRHGKLIIVALVMTVEERLYTPINRYCIFLNDSKLTITKDVVCDFTQPQKDTLDDFVIVLKKRL